MFATGQREDEDEGGETKGGGQNTTPTGSRVHRSNADVEEGG